MKNIWNIYLTDWRNVLKVPTGILLMIALAVLPSVYNWVNIISVWDPYSQTGGIKIAVTSLDQGAELEGTSINIGENLIENLKSNTKLGWTFVDEETARDGVNSGKYYASLLIPADFSQKIAGIAKGQVNKPEVQYTVNEKINAVAPKITGSGVSAITEQINESFIRSVSETVLGQLKEASIEIENNIPTLRKVKSGLFELESSLPEIENMSDKVLHVADIMPELQEKAQKIVLLEEKLPELEQAGQVMLELEEQWPHVVEAAELINGLQQRMPDLLAISDWAASISEHSAQIDEALSKGIERLEQADAFITTAQQALPELERLASNGNAFAEGLQQFLSDNEAAFQALPAVVKQNLMLLQQTSLNVMQIIQQLNGADIDPQEVRASLLNVREKLELGSNILGNTISLLETVNGYLDSPRLAERIKSLQAVQDKMNRQITIINKIVSAIDRGEEPVRELMTELLVLSGEANEALSGILDRFDTEIVPDMQQALDRIAEAAESSAKLLGKAETDLLPGLKDIMANAKTGVNFSLTGMKELQQQLPGIYRKIDEVAASLQERLQQFSKALDTIVPFLDKELPVIEQKLHQAADFIRNDLGQVEEQIAKASNFVQHQLPDLEIAVNRAADLIRADLPSFESAVHQAVDKLRELESEQNLAELIQWLKGDIEAESEFLAKPVHIQETRLYAIPNYGSAMTPFYIVLSLWVGATLLISLLRVDVEGSAGRYKAYQIYFGRMLFFLTIGLVQAIIMTAGDLFLLGTYVVNKFWFVMFAVLVSSVFVTITYTLLAVFGNVGKGIAIVFMVFQFSSSGGTFPISTASPFFQLLNPFMPFTYAISLLREAVGGIYVPTVLKDVSALLVIIGICYLVGLLLKKPLSGFTARSQANAKKTKIIA